MRAPHFGRVHRRCCCDALKWRTAQLSAAPALQVRASPTSRTAISSSLRATTNGNTGTASPVTLVRQVGRNGRRRRNYFASASAVNVAEIEAEIRALRPQVAHPARPRDPLQRGLRSMGFGRFESGLCAFLIGATPLGRSVLHVRGVSECARVRRWGRQGRWTD
jgi:hypothetical protein